jgi:hypothetical protein
MSCAGNAATRVRNGEMYVYAVKAPVTTRTVVTMSRR